MINFQVFPPNLPISVWALGTIILGIIIAFFLFRVKMNPKVKDLADLAYKAAAEIAGVKPKGSTPPVGLKKAPWELRGSTIIGNYKSFGFFGKVLWDRILVVKDFAYIWSNLVHEMTHAVRRRKGLPSSERAAEAAEALANGMRTPEVNAAMEKLR